MTISVKLGLGFAAMLALSLSANAQMYTNRSTADFAYVDSCMEGSPNAGDKVCVTIFVHEDASVKKDFGVQLQLEAEEHGKLSTQSYSRRMRGCTFSVKDFSLSKQGALLAAAIDTSQCDYVDGFTGLVNVSGQWSNPRWVRLMSETETMIFVPTGERSKQRCNRSLGDGAEFYGAIGSNAYSNAASDPESRSAGFSHAACNSLGEW